VTMPSGPEIVLVLVEATCDPSETLPVGALIDNAPAVSVKVAAVVARAGAALPAANAEAAPTSTASMRTVRRSNSLVMNLISYSFHRKSVACSRSTGAHTVHRHHDPRLRWGKLRTSSCRFEKP
jgi:hypothetical protein